jgi:hypothetical protein
MLTLEHICKNVGYPKTIRVDQGSEFVSRDLDIWAYQKGVMLDFSRPGKPGWLTHRGSSMTIPVRSILSWSGDFRPTFAATAL